MLESLIQANNAITNNCKLYLTYYDIMVLCIYNQDKERKQAINKKSIKGLTISSIVLSYKCSKETSDYLRLELKA